MNDPRGRARLPARSPRLLLRWALVAAGLTAVVVTPFAVLGYRQAADGARADTESWARSRIDEAVRLRMGAQVTTPDNTWLVNPVDGWSDPVGEVWADPPLLSLASEGMGGLTIRRYDFNGAWLGYAHWVVDNEVLVTVVERDVEMAAISDARLRWAAVPLGLAVLAGGAAALAVGRFQAPVRRAHAVNRDFIADAAHELRTPLSIIQASAGFALSRERSPEEYRESLTEILTASERAGASVGELLEFARLEAGQASLRVAPLRLDLLVEEVAASIRVDGVTVQEVPGEAVVVAADYNLIRQVIDNIARNAAARATKVWLSTRLASREAVIEVTDDGPGFDPGMIDHVFERFRRGDRSGSVGLGMAVARTVVELHGGTCSAANRPAADGGGAVVTIRLPYKPDR